MSDLELIHLASGARESAYAPYSNFKVGAALLVPNGEVILGCNVENISFGLTICAERVAVGTAVQRGFESFSLLAIVANSAEPVVPCGACRQVLAEFKPDLRIITANLQGRTAEFFLSVLLPQATQGILE